MATDRPASQDAQNELESHGLPPEHAKMVADAETDPAHQATHHEGDPQEGWSRAALLQQASQLGIENADALSTDDLNARIQKSAGVASHNASSSANDPGDGVIV